MNKVVWFFQILLILAFGLFGAQKVFLPIADLIAFGMLWIEDFPAWQVRVIGALEVLAVIGMTVPYKVKALPKLLVPLAAGGLALTMIGALATHISRQDPALSIIINTILFGMSVAVAYKRFGEIKSEG